jgi:Tfp pilus assembly protein PilF
MQHETLTHKIIGCAMNVHRALGNGFQEVIYQRALEIEMQQTNLIMVELKALAAIEKEHLAQAKNYLEAYKTQIGLLINFGANSLEFKNPGNPKIL